MMMTLDWRKVVYWPVSWAGLSCQQAGDDLGRWGNGKRGEEGCTLRQVSAEKGHLGTADRLSWELDKTTQSDLSFQMFTSRHLQSTWAVTPAVNTDILLSLELPVSKYCSRLNFSFNNRIENQILDVTNVRRRQRGGGPRVLLAFFFLQKCVF